MLCFAKADAHDLTPGGGADLATSPHPRAAVTFDSLSGGFHAIIPCSRNDASVQPAAISIS